jgi:hypothetical protein
MYLRAPLRAPRQCPAQRLPVLARRGSKWAFYGTRLNTRLPLTGKKPNVGTKSGKYSAFFDSSMKPLGCAPYPQTRRHPRTAGGADAPHLCTSKRYDPKADELLLGTDAVDVVVKATVARAGQIAAATENSIAEPAPSTAETSAGSSLFRCSEEPQHNVKGPLTGRSRRINHSARVGNAPQQNTAIRSPRRRGRAAWPARRGPSPSRS